MYLGQAELLNRSLTSYQPCMYKIAPNIVVQCGHFHYDIYNKNATTHIYYAREY